MEVMKQLRQQAIRDLVVQRPIRTQQELAGALRDRGFRATQATVSRDVAELGLVKQARDGALCYALPPRRARPSRQARNASVTCCETCRWRSRVGADDRRAHAARLGPRRRRGPRPGRWPEVVGSIAGDDTVFIACRDRTSLTRARQRIVTLAG